MQIIPEGCRTEQDFRRHYIAARRRIIARALPPEPPERREPPCVALKGVERAVLPEPAPEPPQPAQKPGRMRMAEPDWAVIYAAPIGPVRHALQLSDVQKVRLIIRSIAAEHGYSINELKSDRREVPLALARHIAMWLMKQQTMWSYPKIGKAMGDRDHSSAMHAVRRIDRLIAEGKIKRPVLLWADE